MQPPHSLRFNIKNFARTGSVHLFLIIATVAAILPVMWMFTTSVKPLEEVYAYPPRWIPSAVMWENYAKAWNAAPFTQYTLNSIFVTGVIIFSQLFFAVLAAYVFARLQFPGRDLIFLAFLATMMVPVQVVVVPTFLIFKSLGWIDTYMGLTVPFLVSAFGTFLIRQSFLSIPEELIDAARIDGAGHARIIWNLLIPNSTPAFLSFALLTFTWRWNDYFWPLIMTNSTAMRTLPVGLVFLRSSEGSVEWNVVMAAATFVIMPVIVLFIILQKYFVQGVLSSGVKG
jgi:ABC-type glycerol-3-phosphate transport system permease component